MQGTPERLIMQVAEPWDFAGGPVRLVVQERPLPNRWLVTVVSGWQKGEAVLAARYEGETLLPVSEGREVVANLTATDRPASLSGTIRVESI